MNNRGASTLEAGRLVVPDDCRMYGGFTDDRDICIVLGNLANDPSVVFERFALERFARLAHELLAMRVDEEEPGLPVLVTAGQPDNPDVPNLAAGEQSVFVQELQRVQGLLGRYVQYLLVPEKPDTEPFPFEEQMLLSVRLAVLAHGMRELAYARTNEADEVRS
jgi:hypothetical protein